MEWARGIQSQGNKSKVKLTCRVEQLLKADQDEENLSSLINTKIQLSWEIEKDEVY